MMPLLNKLLAPRNERKRSDHARASTSEPSNANEGNAFNFGADQIRVLLFRECEWRGRKLLFDSIAVKRSCTNSQCNLIKSDAEAKSDTHQEIVDGFIYEHEKIACGDVSLLGEMVFGSVAMTYKGPSFKVHAIDSPPCIMCTKVFPSPDYNICKQSERHSDETLGPSVNTESNSSSGSVRTFSRPSSGNLSSSGPSPQLRKNSTCSSTCSSWDIDVPSPHDSSQSLESANLSGVGSLSSLRRRWWRAVSTSLSRSESDDIFGAHCGEFNGDSHDSQSRRQKTRLGLAMLVQLTRGQERKMEAQLLEHAAMLEGTLDRIHCSCFESSRDRSQGKGKGLVSRMYRASARCTIWLVQLLVDPGSLSAPSIWHEVLLNSTVSMEMRVDVLYRSLHQMCQLLDDADTKSTNFFLSTVVTAVLTYHLGWVQTVLPSQARQLAERLGKTYPCNPLWAQLTDLYGALGTPLRLVHTVVAGDSEKTELMNAVLAFLSYFIRSGIVERRREYRCPSQQDVQEAIVLLEQVKKKHPALLDRNKATGVSGDSKNLLELDSNSLMVQRKSSKRRMEIGNSKDSASSQNEPVITIDTKLSKLKRSSTMLNSLDNCATDSTKTTFEAPSLKKEFQDERELEKNIPSKDSDEDCATSKVKIIVNEIAPHDLITEKEYLQTSSPLQDLEKKFEVESEERYMGEKIASLHRHQKNGSIDVQKLYSSDIEDEECSFLPSDPTSASKQSQVYFTLGNEERFSKAGQKPEFSNTCQCSFAFVGAPSTSAQLLEDVLRKIIQRNFPQSSKSIQSPPGTSAKDRPMGFCLKCNGNGYSVPLCYENGKHLLETPTNATEVLRTCGNTVGSRSGGRINRSNSLEALMEANGVVELPMPRSKKVTKKEIDRVGFADTLLHRKVSNSSEKSLAPEACDSGYSWGLVVQGLVKRKKKRRKLQLESKNLANEGEAEAKWWQSAREELSVGVRFPVIDQPVPEAFCILADLDTWQVGLMSNCMSPQSPPLPVGMSRLVANMLEAFHYVWRKYRSPMQCVHLLEGKLREMWLRSEALSEMLLTADVCEANISNLTNALDLDAADIPLLLAVATTHSPQITQRFGLTLA